MAGHQRIDLKDTLGRLVALGGITAAMWIAGRFAPTALVPDNVSVVRTASAPLVLVAILVVWAFQDQFHRYVKALAITTLVSLLLLIGVYQSLVASVSIGAPPREEQYLVGYKHTPYGDSVAAKCARRDAAELIECAGTDQIVDIWGASYAVATAVYLMLLATFLVSVTAVLTLAVMQQRATPAAGP